MLRELDRLPLYIPDEDSTVVTGGNEQLGVEGMSFERVHFVFVALDRMKKRSWKKREVDRMNQK